jgi:hypothetical protein
VLTWVWPTGSTIKQSFSWIELRFIGLELAIRSRGLGQITAGALTRDKRAIWMMLKSQDGSFAVIGVASMVAVRELRANFS